MELILGFVIQRLKSLGYSEEDTIIFRNPTKDELISQASYADELVLIGYGDYDGNFNYRGDAYFDGCGRDKLRKTRRVYSFLGIVTTIHRQEGS
jgi:hypothetical protein